MVSEGDKVLINGKEYTLAARIGSGLEGNIFDIEGERYKKYVIKIIDDEKMTGIERADTYKHLKWLYNLGSRNKEISQVLTLPKALLDDHLGYVMLKAYEHDGLKKYIQVPDDMSQFETWYKTKFTLKKRYQIIKNIFDSLRKLHLAGLIFTDLSPNNIMVHKKENQIVFIDTDNTRRRTDSYLGVLGTPGYMAPEIYRIPDEKMAKSENVNPEILSNCGRITPDSDIFSAAIIAFQLLTLQHPFIGDEIEDGEPELEDAALEIKTDYIFKKNTSNISTSNLTPQFEKITTPKIRELFYQTFVTGKDNPFLRPTDEEFLEAFQNALDLIVECPHCGFSKIYSFDENNDCINCGEKIGPKIVMIIYNQFTGIKRDDLINSIGNYQKLNINFDNLKNESGNDQTDFFEVSRIVLEAGERNKKTLYLRHFETNTERSKPYAEVTLSDSENSLKIKILNNSFSNAYLVEKSTNTHIQLGEGKEGIKYDKYGIIFDTKKHGNGYLNIFCKFIKA